MKISTFFIKKFQEKISNKIIFFLLFIEYEIFSITPLQPGFIKKKNLQKKEYKAQIGNWLGATQLPLRFYPSDPILYSLGDAIQIVFTSCYGF